MREYLQGATAVTQLRVSLLAVGYQLCCGLLQGFFSL